MFERVFTIASVVLLLLGPPLQPVGLNADAAEESSALLPAASTFEFADQLADGQFVLSSQAVNFSTRDYLTALNSPLAGHSDAIDQWCAYASINPRVLLTVLEMRTGLVTGGESVYAPIGPVEPSLETQIEGLANGLADAFYKHLYTYGSRAVSSPGTGPSLRLADATLVQVPAGTSSASYAVLSVLATSSSLKQWQEDFQIEGPGSFVEVYRRLFPDSDPLDTSSSIDPPAAPPTNLLQFPFPVGSSWWFNGPHNWRGNGTVYGPPFSSIDFGVGSSSCSAPPATSWATAAASGSGYHPSGYSCWYRIDHGNGWMTSYYHLRNPTVNGQTARDGKIGTIGCELCAGGSANAPHVHFSLLYNGAYVDLGGTVLSGWTVYPGNGGYSSGYLKRGGETKRPYDIVFNGGIPTADKTLPEGDYTSPADGLVISSGIVAMTAWAKDDSSGVKMVQFTAKWGGAWHVVLRDETAPYAFKWNLCEWGVPDGDIEISLHVQDYAGNNFYLGSKNATRHLTKKSDCAARSRLSSLYMPWAGKATGRRASPLPE